MLNNNNPKLLLLLCIAVAGFTACSKIGPFKPITQQSGETVLYWNEVAYNAFGGTQYQHSLQASRINATMHLAMHDAVNSVQEKYARFAYSGNDLEADPITAAAVAAHTVLLQEIPTAKGLLDSALASSLKTIPGSEAKSRGISLGVAAAAAVLAKRGNDGSAGEAVVPVPATEVPGMYRPVPPFNFLFAPHWNTVKPFALQRPDQFRSAPYPGLHTAAYATDFQEAMLVGQNNSATRTAAQTTYANFWYEFSEAGWNRVARIAAANKHLDLRETARLFALLDMALADAYIAGWDAKIHYNFWRPLTAVRLAATDGNDATAVKSDWVPYMPTPPIQDYPSTHSALGNAAATVLTSLLGDATPFTMTSPTGLPGKATRSFASFRIAADENADSRVMAGIHFRFSCKAGQEMGDKIGRWTVDTQLATIK